jgi:hypothetical protein
MDVMIAGPVGQVQYDNWNVFGRSKSSSTGWKVSVMDELVFGLMTRILWIVFSRMAMIDDDLPGIQLQDNANVGKRPGERKPVRFVNIRR